MGMKPRPRPKPTLSISICSKTNSVKSFCFVFADFSLQRFLIIENKILFEGDKLKSLYQLAGMILAGMIFQFDLFNVFNYNRDLKQTENVANETILYIMKSEAVDVWSFIHCFDP